MAEQLSMFEIFDPLAEVVKEARPVWARSEERIKAALKDPQGKFTQTVKYEYCPYGLSGHFWGGDNRNELCGYELNDNGVYAQYIDESGEELKRRYSWAQFAAKLAERLEE